MSHGFNLVYNILTIIVLIIANLFFIFWIIHYACSFWYKNKPGLATKKNKIAVIIAARNEEKVISNVLTKMLESNYPKESFDIYVVCHNCKDETYKLTKELAKNNYNVFCYELNNPAQRTKGFPVQHAFLKINETKGKDYYDAYALFDAGTLMDKEWLNEMNNAIETKTKYGIFASNMYIQNYNSSIVSGTYTLAQGLRDSSIANKARGNLGCNCLLIGCGLCFTKKTYEKMNYRWDFLLLTEDAEMGMWAIANKIKTLYVDKAKIYDEVPISVSVEYKQRLRWQQGWFQLVKTPKFKKIWTKNILQSLDYFCNYFPLFILYWVSFVLNLSKMITCICLGSNAGTEILWFFVYSVFIPFGITYAFSFVFAWLIIFKRIEYLKNHPWFTILVTLCFPFFVMGYWVFGNLSVITKPNWTPIPHVISE